jgi:transcriptional regulator with GAF, ATPase, and Fis domain
MTQKNLRRILSRRGDAAPFIDDLSHVADAPVAVWDADGNLLLGAAIADPEQMPERHPILCDGEVVGWVLGGESARPVASLLTHLVAREVEKEELLDEILDLYRQANLLFNLSEKLAASLALDTVARTALDEASRLIEATGGAVILLGEQQELLPVATMGQGIPAQWDLESQSGIVGAVVAGARAEIVNDVRLDRRYVENEDSMRSLICAPLTSKNRVMGAIVIVSQVPVTYTAADLKLLNTLGSQAAPAIENALLYQKTLREAQEREERLRQQVRELRIELDEAKQKEKVAEITGSEYYQRLRSRADVLRSIISDQNTP